MRYYADFVKPKKSTVAADEVETAALHALSDAWKTAPPGARPRTCRGSSTTSAFRSALSGSQRQGRDAGAPGVSNAWFNAIYEVLLGEEKGPRFGTFIELYGVKETRR